MLLCAMWQMCALIVCSLCCSVLQCVAVCCSVLQCVAVTGDLSKPRHNSTHSKSLMVCRLDLCTDA